MATVADEPTRARYPDETGSSSATACASSTRSTATGEPTILLLPTWAIVHSRAWKAQIPYLARHFRVVTFDGRGNGRSDRPRRRGLRRREFAADAVAVLDATGRDRAIVVALVRRAATSLHPRRASIRSGSRRWSASARPCRSAPTHRERGRVPVRRGARHRRGLGQVQPPLLAARLARLRSSSSSASASPSRTRRSRSRTRSAGRWRPTPRRIAHDADAAGRPGDRPRGADARAARSRCPVLVVHGHEDAIVEPARAGERAGRADRRRARHARGRRPRPARPRPGAGQPADPRVRRARRAAAPPARAVDARPRARRKRALYLSSPIGLGHARRDLAIADELRALHPDLQIDWLAQDPVTRGARGATASASTPPARTWPASPATSSRESAEHDLHCFQALRRMDEILVANFMVFDDLVERRALRPVDRRRGLGPRLLPAREPRAEARRLRAG